MSIGKIINKRTEGKGDDARQIVHIVLLPSFPPDKYNEVQPGKQYATARGAGATLWTESGHELEVIEATGYPNIAAKSLDPGNVFGKVTNDDKEALAWMRKVGLDLLPSNVRGIPLWIGLAQWNLRYQPLKDRLESAEHADVAHRAVLEIKELDKLSGLAKDTATSAAHPIESAKMTAQGATNEGKQALKEVGRELKNEAKDWWGDIGFGWKIGGAAVGLVVVAMYISEKVK